MRFPKSAFFRVVGALFLALGLGLSFACVPAPAGENGAVAIKLFNRTGTDLYGLFLAPAGSGSWGEDLLEGARLREGEDVTVTFPWGARSIWWDVRAENSEGVAVVWKDIPVRRFRQLTLLFEGGAPKARCE